LELKNADLEATYIPYSTDDPRQFVQNCIGSGERAKKEIGFKYSFDLRSGLQRLIDWRIQSGIDRT